MDNTNQPPDGPRPNRGRRTPPDQTPAKARSSKRSRPFGVFFQTWALLTLIFLFLAAGGFVAALLRFQNELPSTSHLEQIEPPINTRICARDGQVLGDLFSEDRLIVPLVEIPEDMIQAVLASEDRRFREHWGVELPSLLRAVLANLRSGRTTQGGSTITQQLAKNLFLSHERTVTRKIKEALLTIRIERIYSKDEILGMYFNQIYYGNGAHGAKSAAREYFGKELRDLSLAECAYLAGIPANPTLFDPRRRPENAKRRQEIVLGMMRDYGAITTAEAAAAKDAPVAVITREKRTMRAPYFVEYVRKHLVEKYGEERLYKDGLQVTTTLDTRLQELTELALESHLRRLEELNEYEVVRDSAYVPPPQPPSNSPYVQGAAIVLDTRSGEILAMVGGRNFWESRWNRATQAPRQSGSAFKPFVYAAALEQGIGASTVILDEPLMVPMPNGDLYKPENHKRHFVGPVTMRTAVAKSINVPAVRMILTVGPEAAVDVAHRCGIRSHLHPYPSTALGASETRLLELTSAYTVFPNLGIHQRPWSIREVRDRNGAVIEKGTLESEEALSAAVAGVMTNLLEEVMNTGTGASARWRGIRSAAGGKTGTMDDYNDALFIGFTPFYTMGIWVGFDERASLGDDMTGTNAALPVWIAVMKEAHEGLSVPAFETPSGLVWREVCLDSGFLVTPACTETYREVFIEGDEPTEPCPVHHAGHTVDLNDDLSFEALDRSYLKDVDPGVDPRPNELE